MKHFVRNLSWIFSIAVMSVLMTGCSKESDSVTTSISSAKVEVQGVSFTVTSNVEWSISQSGSYSFRVNPTSGLPGTTTVNVAYEPNNTDQDRSSTLTVTAGSALATVQLTQSPVEFAIDSQELLFAATPETKSIKITSNTEWDVKGVTVPDWISSITPQQGTGNGELKITVKENKNRISENSFSLKINYAGSLSKRVEIKQEAAYNNPPTAPVPVTPADKAENVSTMPYFSWNPSTDVEGDEITYAVHISDNGKDWKNFSSGTLTSVTLPARFGVLEASSQYYYKVVANDGHNKGITESQVYTFTTSSKDAYGDGEHMVYMKSEKSSPVYLFFTGDGYLAEHFKYGGQFDKDIDEAIEAFFSIEPYKSYREYFTVYKIAAYSNETGITNLAKNEYRDTRFRLQWEGGNSTGISIPDSGESIFNLCKTIEGIGNAELKKGAIGVISNADVYAGTCLSYIDGRSIASIPYLRNSKNSMTTFANVVCHEMGGHGFGRLADEYQNSNSSIPESEKETLLYWQERGAHRNISVKPQQSDSPWSNFIGVQGYSHVGMFEGGGYYKYGVWRPEKISCMEDNRLYYNSPSRYFIVERIMSIAGEEFNMEKFVAKDVEKTDNTQTKGVENGEFIPLGKPILMY